MADETPQYRPVEPVGVVAESLHRYAHHRLE